MTHDPDNDDLDQDYDDVNFDEQNLNEEVAHANGAGHPRKLQPKTVELYLGYVKTLRKKYLAQSFEGHERDVLPIDLVDYLISRAPTFRPKTFINYRCGLLYWMSTLPETPDVHHARLLLQVGIPKSGYKGPKPKTTSTLYSSKSSRPRTFPKRRFEQLIAELNRRIGPTPDARRNRRPMELMLWLRAGLATGLRPAEWEFAKWHDRAKRELWVRTAKRKTDVNALPSLKGYPVQDYKERIVVVDEEDVIWVDQHLSSVRRHLLALKPFRSYYDNNRVYLWSICKDLFNEKPPFTLYLMRGQFAANRKKRHGVDKVAEEMGCAPKVASTYYGKKRYGHASDIAEVQHEMDKEAIEKALKSGHRTFNFNRSPQPVDQK